MADKNISELVAATLIGPTDLFVMEQGGTAKKATGQLFENWLLSFADGHGGIQSLVKTSSTGTDPVIDTYTITYSDTTTSTFTVTNGLKGDKGDQTYFWIKYAAQYPTSDSDMSSSPDDWIGVYSGTSSTAPTHYTDYTWFDWKGETGDPATLQTNAVAYQVSDNGTTVPTGTWTENIPSVMPGDYLWTRVILTWNNGSPVTYYTVSRYGVDGQGSPGMSIPLPDNTNGAVGTSMSFSREDHQHPLREIVAYTPSLQSSGSLAASSTTTIWFDCDNYLDTDYELISVMPYCDNGWCKATVGAVTITDHKYRVPLQCYNGHPSEPRTFDVSVRFVLTVK